MREREREEGRVRDGEKEQGAETGVGRWDRRTGGCCISGRGTGGGLGAGITEEGMEKRRHERARGGGPAGLEPLGQGRLRTGGCQGSYPDGSDFGDPQPRAPPVSSSPAHHRLSRAGR